MNLLEVKECECGCGKTWKATPNSPNRYYSYAHSQGWQFKISRAGVDREPHIWKSQDNLHYAKLREKYGKLL